MSRARFRNVVDHVAASRPDIEDIRTAIEEGRVVVAGAPVTNANARVRADAPVVVRGASTLRGEAKLAAALDAFDVRVEKRVALDVGAAAGGFTRVLLTRGAAKVFAVDAGHGQLRGELRQDPKVVNLERTNVGELTREVIPDPIGVVTVDLSYLSIADALPQLEPLAFEPDADLIALVKPMFELGLPEPPAERPELHRALAHAVRAVGTAPWKALGTMPSPVTGAHGAREFLIHGRRAQA
jgi:23S rRNA (cytidine1920-2'-O)/16S rRNA (cytidine1409-2'-O)-methyltransferase